MAGIQIDGVNNKIDFDDDADTSISSSTDDTLLVEVGGNTLATVTATSVTINDGTTITTADNTDTLTLTSTDADASSGPNIVLNRDSGSPADNDIVGQFTFRADNDAGEATDYCRFRTHLEDVSDGAEDGNFRLFTLSGGAELSRLDIDAGETVFNEDSGNIDFRVESNGDTHAIFVNGGTDHVGICAGSAPTCRLEVEDSVGDIVFRVNNLATSGNIYGQLINFSYAPDDNSNHFFYVADTVANRMFIYSDGDIKNHDNSYGQVSDERIKQNIKDANSQWDDIKALKVRNFERKDDVAAYGEGKKVQIGLIAQECEAVSPGLVKEAEPMAEDIKMSSEFGTLNEDGTIKTTTGEKVKGISYSVLYMKAIKALQEAMARIEALEG